MQIESNIQGPYDPFRWTGHRGHELATLAAAQHGVVARRQLLALGFSVDEIKGMLRSRRLLAVHRGTYAVGHDALTEKGRWLAAVLAYGPAALLSHRSAGALSNVRRSSMTFVEVTVPTERRAIDRVRPVLRRRIEPQDRTTIDAIPCTSVALTLLNLAAVLPRRGLERACDEAEVQRLFDLAAIEELLERSKGCRGAAKLRSVLAEHAIGTTLTRSTLEERALALFQRYGIPRPEVNVRVVCRAGVAPEVDFLWRRERVVLETDGLRFHSTPRQIERDRRKEADLVCAGQRVLRATWRQIEDDPANVALMLRAALADYVSASA